MKILLLTNEYPNDAYPKPDSPWVLPYFAREWVKQGHEVTVVVNSTKFPRLYYVFARLVSSYYSKKFEITASNLSDRTWARPFSFVDNGVKVWNIPMLKLKPGGKFRGSAIDRQVRNICSLLSKNGFTPDVITGHWVNPQLMLVAILGQKYRCKTAFVFHSDYGSNVIRKFDVAKQILDIDRIGCRSAYAAKELRKMLGLPKMPFVCYSGVPDQYISNISTNTSFCEGRRDSITIICAARLVGYKNIDSIIDAMAKTKHRCSLRIAGEGPLKESLIRRAQSLDLDKKVSFLGKISRESLQEEMHRSTMFVLISNHEVFGLVYLEAMLQGCIVVAGRESGAEGIIREGENGFLCESGNSVELAKIIESVAEMPQEELQQMSSNAQKTAQLFSDAKVAEMYLRNIVE